MRASETLQIELFNFHYNSNLNKMFSETNCSILFLFAKKKSFLCSDCLGSEWLRRSAAVCVRTFSCTLWTIQRWQADLLWQADTWSLSWQRFPTVCRKEQKSSRGQNDDESPTTLHSSWSKILPLNSLIIFSVTPKRFFIIIHRTDFGIWWIR